MLKRLNFLFELGVGEHLNTYEILRLKIVNRLAVLCMALNLVLISLNLVISNPIGILIDLAVLFLVLVPVLYLTHNQTYYLAIFIFILGYHLAAVVGSVQTILEGRINEVELLFIPGAIGLTILLRGRWQALFYALNMMALAGAKYLRWESFGMPIDDYYKLLAIIVICYAGIYFFITQFKTQLLTTLDSMEFLNNALLANELKLKESNKAKDRLFSVIAHDLRSPLDLIQGLLDPAGLTSLEKEEFIKHQTTIRSRIAVLQETMNNLLNWAKSQLGHLEANFTDVRVLMETKNIFDLFTEMITSKGITVQYQADSEFTARVDKDHFNVIMRNIIHNAIKFSPRNGRITLEVMEQGSSVKISVSDPGTGIDQKTKYKILNSQLVASDVGTDGERGSGIGLSFCYELVKKNQGELIISNVESGGARLEVLLPKA